ncbi:MAG TPA: hypothetical protein VHA33_24030 [Candidatus Angelobacter sp.]|nr:hypothetical protein [Candidatus Angelobacter sp.]
MKKQMIGLVLSLLLLVVAGSTQTLFDGGTQPPLCPTKGSCAK